MIEKHIFKSLKKLISNQVLRDYTTLYEMREVSPPSHLYHFSRNLW